MKEGTSAGTFDVLTADGLHRIHAAALSLLENPGVLSRSGQILDLFQKGGARVDGGSGIIRVPADMVEAAIASAPRSFVIHGRDSEMDLRVEPGRIFYGMGGTSVPSVWDHPAGRPRDPTKADMAACTRVGQALSNIDFIMALCTSGDAPKDQSFFHDYDAMLRNTTKPIVFSVVGREATASILSMAAASCGGESALRRRPLGMAMASAVSPLMVTELTEGIIDAVEFGVPVRYGVGPMMGGTSPATVAGTLAQSLAETLFGLVLVQLIRVGAPVVLAPNTNVMDMATGQCTYGSPEQTLGKMAVGQLGRFYGLPTWATGGGVESKLPDSEAAAQAMMGMLLCALAGVTFCQNLGTLASGLYGSMEQLLICDEIVSMVKRILAGLAVTEETLALDVIREVGHGKDFLTHAHTLGHFRSDLFFPALFRRQSIDQWLAQGARSMADVAHERVRSILAEPARPDPEIV
jgi:trimethylamine---corrinoid protein Co-methyltransferase